jgi:hypothetical protein
VSDLDDAIEAASNLRTQSEDELLIALGIQLVAAGKIAPGDELAALAVPGTEFLIARAREWLDSQASNFRGVLCNGTALQPWAERLMQAQEWASMARELAEALIGASQGDLTASIAVSAAIVLLHAGLRSFCSSGSLP